MLSRRMILALFILLIQLVEEGKGTVVITVSEEEEYIKLSGSGDLSEGSGFSQDVSPCCTTGNCTCDSFLHALVNLTDNAMVYITSDVVLSSIVPMVGVENITILGYDNPTVYCNGNGGVRFASCNNVIVEDIVWEGCGSNISPTLEIRTSSNITIQRCTFQHSQSQAVHLSNVSEYVYINNCTFVHNYLHRRVDHGIAILYSSQNSQVKLTIDRCNFIDNKRKFFPIFTRNIATSVVYIYGNNSRLINEPVSLQNCVFINNTHSVSLFIYNHSLHINGNVSFENNKGSSILSHNSNITFSGNSNVKFYKNLARYGGAINSYFSSVVTFKEHCKVNFTSNRAIVDGGAIYSIDNSVVSFEGNSTITFARNLAKWGGAMYSKGNSTILFKGNSSVMCDNNNATQNGGAIYLDRISVISFQECSVIRFHGNRAIHGGAIVYFIECSISFEGHSKVIFNANSAVGTGGAIYSNDNDVLSFKGNSEVTFTGNSAAQSGGAITSHKYHNIFCEGQSVVRFKRNTAAIDGGAIHSSYNSMISIGEQSEVTFIANRARADGGALYFTDNSKLLFTRFSKATFTNNTAMNGGAMCFKNNSVASFEGASTVTCTKNSATQNGGVIYSDEYTDLTFAGDAVVKFAQNNAILDGGVILLDQNCNITFEGNSTVTFAGNSANRYSGAIYSDIKSVIVFSANSTVIFLRNSATSGGAVYSHINSNMSFKGNSVVSFIHNTALQNGGAIYITTNSNILFEGNYSKFISNTAMNGGAIFTAQSIMQSRGKSAVAFDNNTALDSGGAIYFSDCFKAEFNVSITFANNLANKYGGAVYAIIDKSRINLGTNHFRDSYYDNVARITGNMIYMAVPQSCDLDCLNISVLGVSKEIIKSSLLLNDITTTPSKVKYYQPAICINRNTASGDCETYYVNNIMLGQEIKVDACVLDYYDQPSSAVQHIVSGKDDENYQINGARELFVTCDNNAFQGISIIGNSALSFNVSLTINFHVDLFSDELQFSIKFVVEISPCHAGFWYDVKSQKCVCYDHNSVVFCTGTTSTIKRGYWFGSVNGQPTVAVCPVNYCNFSCCETTDGFYHLSPLRTNQCGPHRFGPACGNCEEGWTLSFDSAECVKTEKCTAGQTALVVVLTILYWIAVVVAVFVMMYYKVPIGYLYVITYYYSIVDALLDQTLYLSRGLLITFNIVASIFKITPRFLGQLCFLKGMSGIDQEFIHYVHPFAVTLILITISLLARISYKFSSFISRGIIHVICLLLLLSYTSVTTTSLLLMRPLTFLDVDDNIYTYLSPDIEYFHGRHLPYAIVAVLCTIVIVIGLPLLLLLEPLLNQTLNFNKIKPLLDQFQGCYKDRYRYFAAYYMICRLVIITIIITTPSNNVLVQYILIGTCITMAAVQLILRPYVLKSLNTFDGVMLLLLISVVAIPVLDSSETNLLVGVTLFVMLLPIVLFVIMLLLTFKNNIRKIVASCKLNRTKKAAKIVEISAPEFCVIVDDNMRRNATVCNIDQYDDDDDDIDVTRYRESFLEIMDEIED